jgi:5-methylcytosine-specific restriction endonuclease McrA
LGAVTLLQKTCSKCGELKLVSEFYTGKGQCKACISDWKRAYYQANRDQKRAYYQANRDQKRAYYQENRDRIGERNHANPEGHRASQARRRQRVKVTMTKEDREISVAYRIAIRNDTCLYCEAAPGEHDDHWMPLARGGTDHWWNLFRSCARCNLSKHTKCGECFFMNRPCNCGKP